MSCGFTEAHYREVLQALVKAGYRFTGFRDFVPGKSGQVILRHDIDLSLEDALRMARIDEELGISSVFHVMFTAEVYNPLSGFGQGVLKEFRQLGHRLGLHVDPKASRKLPTENEGDARGSQITDCRLQIVDCGSQNEANAGASGTGRQFEWLRRLLELAREVLGEVDSFSLHRPVATGGMDELQPERLGFSAPPYAYAPEFREAILYRSDSRREWRNGCLCGQITGFDGRSLQLALHPIWWTKEPCTRDELLKAWLDVRHGTAEKYLRDNLSFYGG